MIHTPIRACMLMCVTPRTQCPATSSCTTITSCSACAATLPGYYTVRASFPAINYYDVYHLRIHFFTVQACVWIAGSSGGAGQCVSRNVQFSSVVFPYSYYYQSASSVRGGTNTAPACSTSACATVTRSAPRPHRPHAPQAPLARRARRAT